MAFAAAVLGATVWLALTASAAHKNALYAVGIGVLVGVAVRWVAGRAMRAVKPTPTTRKLARALIAFLAALGGCLLGNVLIIIWFVGFDHDIGYLAAAQKNTLAWVVNVLLQSAAKLDVFVYITTPLLAAYMAATSAPGDRTESQY